MLGRRLVSFSFIAMILLAFLALSASLRADVINLGTPANAASWKATGAGAVNVPIFQVNANGPGEISITSTSTSAGVFVPGASLANFNGFYSADNDFFLPANAMNVRLDFNGLFGNDRVVLQLNGIDIGNTTFFGTTGLGVMKFSQTTPDIAYVFTETTSGSVASGFNIGGQNKLRLLVNNHGFRPIDTPTQTFSFANDGVTTRVNATLSFAVPEPSTMGLFLAAAVFVLFRRTCKWNV